MSAGSRFAIAPGLDVEVAGDRAARRHFAAEYDGAAAPAGAAPAALRVTFARERGAGAPSLAGGHKTVGWSVWAGVSGETLSARVVLRGRPRSFALSLVQGYVVEPLLSVAAARRDLVLLPSAAYASGGGAVVLLGRSGAGKSTLMARALAAGAHVLADDQVVVAADGGCRRFPRRSRVYTDLPAVAPGAYAALGRRRRAALAGRRAAQVLSRGWIAPSLAVPPRAFGDPGAPGPLPLRRLVVLERDAGAAEVAEEGIASEDVLAEAAAILADQRARLLEGGDPALAAAVAGAAAREAATLGAALGDAVLARVRVPGSWSAPEAITALERHLATV